MGCCGWYILWLILIATGHPGLAFLLVLLWLLVGRK
jgi:hypothetical protein